VYNTASLAVVRETPLRSGRITHLKFFFSKTYIFLLPTYLVYQHLFCGTLICPLSIWQLGLKLETLKRLNAFPRSTDTIQVLNKMPIFKRHVKVPPGRLLCHTNVDNKKKQVCENFLFNCVTRPDLSGVHLRIKN